MTNTMTGTARPQGPVFDSQPIDGHMQQRHLGVQTNGAEANYVNGNRTASHRSGMIPSPASTDTTLRGSSPPSRSDSPNGIVLLNGAGQQIVARGDENEDPDRQRRRNRRRNRQSNGNLSSAVKPVEEMVRTSSEHSTLATAVSDSGQQQQSEVDLIRHGFNHSDDQLKKLQEQWWMYYVDARHEKGGMPKSKDEIYPLQEWRMRDRLKTISAALAVCLNLGVDPPDVIRTNPSARMECWVDPQGIHGTKALESIGKNLQQQYESLSVRTRYKQYLDPSIDETKKFLIGMRRNAKDERVLFHYNGHGVPKPTVSGEIWVFNKNYTQYIPISLYDIQSWLGSPSLLVFDCSDAGNIIKNYARFVEKREQDNAEILRRDPNHQVYSFTDSIQLAACGVRETLPTNPDLPADLFTCCLTTPVEISLRFFVLQNPLPSSLTLVDVLKIPGRSTERRTPAGELNWIFTAITDTIAWNTLPRDLFKKLFRQDLMVAALFRNFLLSQRIMRVHKCHPQSSPALPETHHHPLWQSWDFAIEMVLAQLPAMKAAEEKKTTYEYQHSNFFAEQLTAFEVYLARGAITEQPPDQLPIVLQVLLSQVHRLRALILLSKFLDLGPWAVNLALSIGIFPYVLKLLQSAASELKPVMVFIWARILAVDQSCQADLLKDNGYQYFIQILNPRIDIPVHNAAEHRAMCAFIITMFCRGYHQAQRVCLQSGVIKCCILNLNDPNPLLRQWACLCIGELWVNFPEAKWDGLSAKAHEQLLALKQDRQPEVRASMLHALNCFLGIPDITEQVAEIEEMLASSALPMTNDGSNLVKRELLVFFSTFVKRYENKFMVCAYEQLVEEKETMLNRTSSADGERQTSSRGAPILQRSNTKESVATNATASISRSSIFASVWKQILVLSVDPYPETADCAAIVIDYVHDAILSSPLGHAANTLMEEIYNLSTRTKTGKGGKIIDFHAEAESPEKPKPQREGREGLLSRTASYAATLKNLAFGSSTDLNSLRATSIKNEKSAIAGADSSIILSPQSKRQQQAQVKPPSRGRIPSEWGNAPNPSDSGFGGSAWSSASSGKGKVPVPRPRGYAKRNVQSSMPLIPLQSMLVDWSIEYFRVPQMKMAEAEEPGSADYNQRLWRRTRNEKIMATTQPQKDLAGRKPWDTSAGFFNNHAQATKMLFHQFEDHLVIADDEDNISVWDWVHHGRLNRFSNDNPRTSRITDIRLINEDDQALLMTGSSDGVIKVFRNYESAQNMELVTAYRALNDIDSSNDKVGLVFEWIQGKGRAIIAGDNRVIKVWGAAAEFCELEIPARSGSSITSLTGDQVAGDIFVAGFDNGAIRVYDQRVPPRDSMVRVWKDPTNKAWITNVHMQRGGWRELVSGSERGEVMLWDIRVAEPVRCINAVGGLANTMRRGGGEPVMKSLSVHEHAPVIATGSSNHTLSLFSTFGAHLSTTKTPIPQATSSSSSAATSHSAATAAAASTFSSSPSTTHAPSTSSSSTTPFLASLTSSTPLSSLSRGTASAASAAAALAAAPISVTAFHPHRMLLACAAAGDRNVSLFRCEAASSASSVGGR